jgi:hypothetical protein
MGHCLFEIHYHANLPENKSLSGSRQYRSTEITSKSKEREVIDNIKNKLNDKITEFGKIIHLKEYENNINENIRMYIAKNKLNYRNYMRRDSNTYFSFPIKFENNNIYYGNWNDNIEMDGYGIYFVNDQKVVTEGIWNRGNIIFGRIFFPNGDIYEGEMKNSVPDGVGKISFSNGESYEGNFILGEMSGEGTFIFADKTIYKGGIKNGIFNGKGIIIWNNGIKYEGHFLDSLLCGNGKISNSQGEEYVGNFDKNEFNGKGVYSFNNGDQYEGNFEYGLKKGKGIYRRNDKIVFEGHWRDDLPNGEGFILYKGNKLKGFWRNGTFVGSPEIEEGNLENFNNIEYNIVPERANISPNSLPHLTTYDSNTSQFIPNNNFI